MLARMWKKKGTLALCWWDCKWMQSLWGTVWRFLKKRKVELTCDPAIPLVGIYPEKNENTNSKRYMLPNVHSSTIYNSQDNRSNPIVH